MQVRVVLKQDPTGIIAFRGDLIRPTSLDFFPGEIDKLVVLNRDETVVHIPTENIAYVEVLG
jgi:hypothetical protein